MIADPPPVAAPEPPPAAFEAADRALRRLLRTEWEVLTRHREGARSASDPEALHDFRVALRRTRSLAKEVADVFPPRQVGALERELAWLADATGPSRDLDVISASLEGRMGDLPSWVREGLKPLLAEISRRREAARGELSQALASPRAAKVLNDLDRFSTRRPVSARTSDEARQPVGELARERLRKAARRVAKRGRGLSHPPSPEELHRLRIACKKLRYLLEFFRPLFPPRAVLRLVRSLKELQDLLGTSNDLAVEGRELRRLMDGERPAGARVSMALGFLLARLEQESSRVEEQIRPALRAFLGRRNQERLRRLTRAEESR